MTARRLGIGDEVNESNGGGGMRQSAATATATRSARGGSDGTTTAAVARCRTDRSLTRGAIRRSSTTRWRVRVSDDTGVRVLDATGVRVPSEVDCVRHVHSLVVNGLTDTVGAESSTSRLGKEKIGDYL
ncbi:hypothetical protein Scep_004470 [Stephania cephalantha]|uniref:Uncharacterized protein n=1 Tax=Stephania cephalantha TaxID=152367 RepID=A0AAP0KSI9_9MAGN